MLELLPLNARVGQLGMRIDLGLYVLFDLLDLPLAVGEILYAEVVLVNLDFLLEVVESRSSLFHFYLVVLAIAYDYAAVYVCQHDVFVAAQLRSCLRFFLLDYLLVRNEVN